jgi:hypothetical protein
MMSTLQAGPSQYYLLAASRNTILLISTGLAPDQKVRVALLYLVHVDFRSRVA